MLERRAPDVVLVHGDTTTSTAAALAAFYQQIPVGHVEAGLRTSDRWLPFPEEMNRRLTGTIASYHFSPTPLAREHLLRETRRPDDIIVTGNTVIDAFLRNGAARAISPAPPALGRARSGSARSSSSPRTAAKITRTCARCAKRCGRSRACRARRKSTGRCIPRRASPRSRTVLGNVAGRRAGRPDRTTPRWSPRSKDARSC